MGDGHSPLFQDDYNPLGNCPSVDGEDREFSWSSPPTSGASTSVSGGSTSVSGGPDGKCSKSDSREAPGGRSQLPNSCSTETLKTPLGAEDPPDTPVLRKVGD